MSDGQRSSQWIRSGTGKAHFLDGSVPILEPEFDYPDDEVSVAIEIQAGRPIGTPPHESRPLAPKYTSWHIERR